MQPQVWKYTSIILVPERVKQEKSEIEGYSGLCNDTLHLKYQQNGK